jgi:hypothetical protein
MTDLEHLIATLEAANGVGNREFDRCIYNLCVAQKPSWGMSKDELMFHDDRKMNLVKRYTTSIDDAMTIVPDHSSVNIHIGPMPELLADKTTVFVQKILYDEQGKRTMTYVPHEAKVVRDDKIYGNTLALAICIAALRARIG